MAHKDAYSISALITEANMEKLVFLKDTEGTTFSRTINTALALFFQEHAELRPERLDSYTPE